MYSAYRYPFVQLSVSLVRASGVSKMCEILMVIFRVITLIEAYFPYVAWYWLGRMCSMVVLV